MPVLPLALLIFAIFPVLVLRFEVGPLGLGVVPLLPPWSSFTIDVLRLRLQIVVVPRHWSPCPDLLPTVILRSSDRSHPPSPVRRLSGGTVLSFPRRKKKKEREKKRKRKQQEKEEKRERESGASCCGVILVVIVDLSCLWCV